MSKKYCSQCLVEVEKRLEHCPLCDNELQKEKPVATGEYPTSIPDAEQAAKLSKGVARTWVLLGITIAGLLAMMICTIVDMTMVSNQGWSVLVNHSILASILVTGLMFYLIRRPIALFIGIWLVVTLFIIAIDAAVEPINWSTEVGVPICGLVLLFFGGWTYLVVRNKWRVITKTILLLLAIALFCVTIDFVFSPNSGNPTLTWSIPVVVSLIVISIVLFVTVQLLKRNTRWRRLFEL